MTLRGLTAVSSGYTFLEFNLPKTIQTHGYHGIIMGNKVPIEIDEELRNRLRVAKAREGLTYSELIDRMIEVYE